MSKEHNGGCACGAVRAGEPSTVTLDNVRLAESLERLRRLRDAAASA